MKFARWKAGQKQAMQRRKPRLSAILNLVPDLCAQSRNFPPSNLGGAFLEIGKKEHFSSSGEAFLLIVSCAQSVATPLFRGVYPLRAEKAPQPSDIVWDNNEISAR